MSFFRSNLSSKKLPRKLTAHRKGATGVELAKRSVRIWRRDKSHASMQFIAPTMQVHSSTRYATVLTPALITCHFSNHYNLILSVEYRIHAEFLSPVHASGLEQSPIRGEDKAFSRHGGITSIKREEIITYGLGGGRHGGAKEGPPLVGERGSWTGLESQFFLLRENDDPCGCIDTLKLRIIMNNIRIISDFS